jgi:hypothetical protein
MTALGDDVTSALRVRTSALGDPHRPHESKRSCASLIDAPLLRSKSAMQNLSPLLRPAKRCACFYDPLEYCCETAQHLITGHLTKRVIPGLKALLSCRIAWMEISE